MVSYKNHSARIAPACQPLEPGMQEAIDAIMRGAPPLVLFTTIARDRRLFFKFFNSGLLDRGNLTIRQREIVIDRVKHCTVDDGVWTQLTAHHNDEAILELLMLAGTYRTVSYLVNGLRLPLEPGARRFPA